jgi:4-hydroxybenzoate polyprenyltransferase
MCLSIYQQWLIKDREPARCFQAFLNNHWVGLAVLLGIVGAYF